MTSSERDGAVRRLESALEEQNRLRSRYDAAIGTSTELGAYVALRVAAEHVSARGAWLEWIDDGDLAGEMPKPGSAVGSESARG
jgi:hypothetical protein